MGVLAVIFIINFSILVRAFMRHNEAQNTEFSIKFNVDKDTQSPNIYWIHADGMLGVSAIEKYFNDKQTNFLNKLDKRGFIVNPTANFEARHSTSYAIPVLMNPYSYDSWICDTIHSKQMLNVYAFQVLRMNSELQYALASKDYALNMIGGYGYYYPIRSGRLWVTGMGKGQIFSFDYLKNNFFFDALNFDNIYVNTIISALFNIFKSNFRGEDYKAQIPEDKLRENYNLDFVSALYDILYGNNKSPRLTIIHDGTPHNPFYHSEDGAIIKNPANMNPLDYLPQHIWSAKVIINMIDMILEVDPDAVIIIQSDHGLHGNTEKDFKKAFGEKANTRELWNSTMSAIRVPEKFQNGEEHYAMQTPLNITRYLVNNFVGKNYEYISPDIAY